MHSNHKEHKEHKGRKKHNDLHSLLSLSVLSVASVVNILSSFFSFALSTLVTPAKAGVSKLTCLTHVGTSVVASPARPNKNIAKSLIIFPSSGQALSLGDSCLRRNDIKWVIARNEVTWQSLFLAAIENFMYEHSLSQRPVQTCPPLALLLFPHLPLSPPSSPPSSPPLCSLCPLCPLW